MKSKIENRMIKTRKVSLGKEKMKSKIENRMIKTRKVSLEVEDEKNQNIKKKLFSLFYNILIFLGRI